MVFGLGAVIVAVKQQLGWKDLVGLSLILSYSSGLLILIALLGYGLVRWKTILTHTLRVYFIMIFNIFF